MLKKEIENIFKNNDNDKDKLRLLLEANVYKLKSMDLFKNASEANFLLVKNLFILPCTIEKEKIIKISSVLETSLSNDLAQLEFIADVKLKESYFWRLLGGSLWINTFKEIIITENENTFSKWESLRNLASISTFNFNNPATYTELKDDYSFYRRAERMTVDESIPSLNFFLE